MGGTFWYVQLNLLLLDVSGQTTVGEARLITWKETYIVESLRKEWWLFFVEMAKQISVAKQVRERALMEFHAASDDLEEELQKTPVNVRRIKSKLQLLKVSYDSVVIAQSEVVTLEKTSASDEANRNWVKEKLRKPFV